MHHIWKMILFYIYSGIALNGLLASKGRDLLFDDDQCDNEEQKKKAEEYKLKLRGDIAQLAMVIGDLMSDSTTWNVIAQFQNQVIQNYEQAKAHNEAVLAAQAEAAKNQRGS